MDERSQAPSEVSRVKKQDTKKEQNIKFKTYTSAGDSDLYLAGKKKSEPKHAPTRNKFSRPKHALEF